MIHRLEITADSIPSEVKKEFRKKLMTGGAVLRISDSVTSGEQRKIFDNFIGSAQFHNVSAMVLEQLAQQAQIPELLHELVASRIHRVLRALSMRTDLPEAVKRKLTIPSSEQNHMRALAVNSATSDIVGLDMVNPDVAGSGRQIREVGLRSVDELVARLENAPPNQLRLLFQDNIGSSEAAVGARLALCRMDSPHDLLWLLSRDPNREVRFAARNRLNQTRKSPR